MDAVRRSCCAALMGAALPLRAEVPLHIGVTAVILADQSAFLARWSHDLGRHCGRPVRFVVREEYQPVMDMLLRRELDAAWVCGFPYVRHAQALQLLAVPVYEGAPQYRSYLIRARGTDAVNGWRDLRGRVLAMSDPLSNSGWLVAQHALREAGVAPGELRRGFFAHGHRHVAEAVAVGLADAGAIDGYVWDTMSKLGLAAARDTEVVWRSPPYGFPPLVAPAGPLSSGLRQLCARLLAMQHDDEGRALLEALNLDGFVVADADLYEPIRALAAKVPGSGVALGRPHEGRVASSPPAVPLGGSHRIPR